MRRFRVLVSMLVVLGYTVGVAGEVVIETVPVGNPGNLGELSGQGAGGEGPNGIVGAVDYAYHAGRFEVTAGQYAEFLNAVARTDTYELYDTRMWTDSYGCKIWRSGTPGSFSYSVASNGADRPVNYVDFWDAARFANWLHNGQPGEPRGAAATEDGAYPLDGYTGSDGSWITRNPGATWIIPSENEWYKAAYHQNNGVTGDYWDYPTGSDSISPSDANYAGAVGQTSVVGTYGDASSPYGTSDQGGNVWEWNETFIDGSRRGVRGGSFGSDVAHLHAAFRSNLDFPTAKYNGVGFRVAFIPEPGSVLLLVGGGWLVWRRRPGGTGR